MSISQWLKDSAAVGAQALRAQLKSGDPALFDAASYVGRRQDPSLIATRSRVLADSGAGISGAGQWRPADGSAQTMTIDSTFTRRPGVSTLKIDATASVGSFNKNYRHALSSTAVTGPIELWIFVPPTTAGGHTITVRYSSDTPAADPPLLSPVNYIEQQFTNDKIQSGYWAPLFWSPSGKLYTNAAPNGVAPTTTGTPDSANIKQIEINWNINTATPGAERYIYIDQMAVNGKGRPLITVGFDGFAYTSNAAIVRPAFDRYGLKGYLAGDGENIADNLATLSSLYDRGWDIISQGQLHKDYVVNIADLSADFDLTRSQLAAQGFTRALDYFAYPLNSRNLATDAILRAKGVRWSRGTGYNRFPVTSLGMPELLAVGALDMGQKTGAQGLAWVDDAILCGYSMDIYMHEITTTASTSTQTATAEFNTLMAGLADRHYAGTIEMTTPSERVKLVAGV